MTPPTVVTPPATPAATPVAPVATTDADVRALPGTLASTGFDAGAILPIGAGLLLAGAGMMVARRRTAERN